MKRKKYKILACALSMGLAFTPNAALAAGTGLAGTDEENLEEDMDDSWEDEEFEDMEDDFWEDEESEDMEDGSWEDEESKDVEDDFWEDEESEDIDEEFWGYEGWDAEDACCGEENVLPVMMCCGMEADELAGAGESEPESVDADDSGVEGTTENAEVTKSQEENGMPYIAGTQGRNYYKAEDAESRDDTIAGVYTPIRKTQLYASAGAEDTAFLEIDENTKIHCYGYYTEADGAKWYYVQYFQNGRSFMGFCSSEELK